MSDFEKLKTTLKDKWLNYYKTHQKWISKLEGWSDEPQEGTRPSNHLILGIVSILEPKIKPYLTPMLDVDKYTSDASTYGNKVVDGLGLNFDPDLELKKLSNNQDISIPNKNFSEFENLESQEEISFDEFKVGIRDKWLDYYQEYKSWIDKLFSYKNHNLIGVYNYNQLVLGVLSVLEPKGLDYLIALCSVDNEGQWILKVLELEDSPNFALQKRFEQEKANFSESKENRSEIDLEYEIASKHLDEIRKQIQQENSS